MSLIPFAGAESSKKSKGKKFESLALFSLRTEFNSLAKRYRAAMTTNEFLRMKLNTALERVADLETIVCRAVDTLNGPQIDAKAQPFAEQAGRIVLTVVDHFGLTPMMLFGRARGSAYTIPRHIAMYLVHTRLGVSVAAVGRYFGGRDHTTVIHAIRNVKKAKGQFQHAHSYVSQINAKLDEHAPATSRAVASAAAPPRPGPPLGEEAAALSSSLSDGIPNGSSGDSPTVHPEA